MISVYLIRKIRSRLHTKHYRRNDFHMVVQLYPESGLIYYISVEMRLQNTHAWLCMGIEGLGKQRHAPQAWTRAAGR